MARAFYEIAAKDVGKWIVKVGRERWHIGFPILSRDVGKRAYQADDGLIQVENDEQRARRLRGADAEGADKAYARTIALQQCEVALRKAMAPPAPLPNLGPLKALYDSLEDPKASPRRIAHTLQTILIRMAEIERECVTKSLYGGALDEGDDEPPTGDTYNDLWDGIIDEIKALVEDMEG